jgi:peptide/nickel transport system substrate-binding protein
VTRRERIGAAAVACALAALLLACRGREPSARGAESLLRIGQLTSGVTLDPHRHDSYYTNVTLGQIYEKLVTLGPDLEIQPELAERWENPSERVWRFHLRRGVVFHDGSAFGAEDVLASIRRAQRPDSHVRHYVQAISEVRKVDEATVDVLTNRPAPVLLNDLVFVMIVPRSTGAAPIESPVGTGPYAFLSGGPGGTIVLRRFERWRGPPPAFDSVSIVPVADAANRATAIASGRVDVVAQFPPESFLKAKDDPSLHAVSRPGLAVDFLAFSVAKRSPFADVRVRRAFLLSVDKDELVRSALLGLGARADQIVPPSVFGYAGSLAPPARDVAAARRLLADAGASSLTVELVMSQRVESVGRAVARQLAEAGVTLVPRVLTQGQFYDRFSKEAIPLALHSYGASTGDAANSLAAMLHTRTAESGTFNLSGYSNPALDHLMERADQELDPAVRRGTLESAMRLVADDVPVVPLVVRHDLYAIRRDLTWTPAAFRLRALDVTPVK